MKDVAIVREMIREALDPVALFEYYGIDLSSDNFKYDKIRTTCPIHKGDNPTSFSFDLNTKMFTCFSHHCGESAHDWWYIPKDGSPVPRDLFLFIKLMEESKAREEGRKNYICSFSRALEIGSKLTGIPINQTTTAYDKNMADKLDNQKWIRQIAKVKQEVKLETFSEEDIELFRAQLPIIQDYVDSRNFDNKIIKFFELGYSPDGVDEPWNVGKRDFVGRLIFPIRDKDGSLVGWSGRLATNNKMLIKKYNKYMHKLDFDKGFVLYNFHNAFSYIKETKELIIVEGTWDVMRLWSYGIFNVVAVMGSSLTPEQLSIAVSHAIKIYIFLDGDGAGKTGAKRIAEQLKSYVDVFIVDNDKDPDELSKEEVYNAIKNAKRYISENRR